MSKIADEIAHAMQMAQEETGLHIPSEAVLIVPLGFEFDQVCGHRTVIAPTLSGITLAECDWRLAKAFEDALNYELD